MQQSTNEKYRLRTAIFGEGELWVSEVLFRYDMQQSKTVAHLVFLSAVTTSKAKLAKAIVKNGEVTLMMQFPNAHYTLFLQFLLPKYQKSYFSDQNTIKKIRLTQQEEKFFAAKGIVCLRLSFH